jgi:type I restriction enzyme S subunit
MNLKNELIGNVCEVIAGQSPPSSTYNKKKIGLPFFQGKADFGEMFPTIRYWCDSPNKIAIPNDILMSVRAPVGPTNICDIECAIGRGLAAIRSNGKTDYKFLYYYLKFIEPKIALKGNGSTFSAITIGEVKKIEVPLPAISAQKHIATILEEADALRKADVQLIRKYDELLHASFGQLFGAAKDMLKIFPSKKLEVIADIASGVAKNTKAFKNDFIDVPYMRVANVQDGHINLNEVKTIKVSKQDFEKYLLKRNDILLTEGGDPDKLGRGAVWHNEITPCIHQNHIFRVRTNENELNSVYLSFLIGSSYGKRYFLKAAKQTTGIASINMTQLKNFDVIIPPLSLQNRFAEIAVTIKEQKGIAQQQQQQSENLFQSLLHKVFKGEL